MTAGVAVALLAMAAGCKPTEANYKAAYDSAVNKKKAEEAADADMMLPATGLQQFDAPRERTVGDVKVAVQTVPLKVYGEGTEALRWNVAVARYKMPTNCSAQVDRLIRAGYKAFYAETPQGWFYVIAGSFGNIEEAASFAASYAEGKEPSVFIGMPGKPVLLEKR